MCQKPVDVDAEKEAVVEECETYDIPFPPGEAVSCSMWRGLTAACKTSSRWTFPGCTATRRVSRL